MTDEQDMAPGEIVRWLQRIDKAITDLPEKLVSKERYELEVGDLKRRFDSFVNRSWWLAALVVTTGLAVIGLYIRK